MWLFALLAVLFYTWPLVVGLGIYVVWKQTKRPLLFRFIKISLVFEVLWIAGVVVMGIFL